MSHKDLVNMVLALSESDKWDRAKHEWRVSFVEEDEEAETTCQCGHEHLRYLYQIENALNGNTLYPIGSKCIRLFGSEETTESLDAMTGLFRIWQRICDVYREWGDKCTIGLDTDKDVFSRKLLEYMNEHGVFGEPQYYSSIFRDERPNSDYTFLLDMFNRRNEMTPRQSRKCYAVIRKYIYPYLFGLFDKGGTDMALGLMAKLAGVQESTGGFSDIEPGAYKLVITKVEPKVAQEYVRIYWDVADGPRKGAYANAGFPPSDVLSWKETALGMLKGKLHRIYRCNPQRLHATNDSEGKFLMVDEFDAGDFNALVGCRFGAVVRRRLYTAGPNSKTPGADRVQMEVARYLTPEEFQSGDWPETLLADRDQRDQTAQAPVQQQVAQVPASFDQTPDLYGEDVPF